MTVRIGLIASLTLSLVVMTVVIVVLTVPDTAGFTIPAVLLTVIGGFLLIRVPESRIGVVLAVGGAAWLVYTAAGGYALLSMRQGHLPGEYVAAWLGSWTGALLPLSLATLLAVFPDGAPPRGWRWLGFVLVGIALLTILGALRLWGLPAATLTDFDRLDLEPRYAWVDASFGLGFLASVPASLSLVVRYRRGNTVARQQIKWLMTAGALLAVVFLAGVSSFGETAKVWQWVLAGTISLLPVAVAIAVLRHNLYDIDRLISRSVTYALVVGLIGAIVGGLIAALALFLPSDDPLVVAVATLAVFALFNPVRRRVQVLVDRRFNRSRFDTARVVDDFGASLQARVDPEGLVDDWVDVVEGTMQPASLGVWVR